MGFGWFVAVGCLLLATFHAPAQDADDGWAAPQVIERAPEIGRYQFAIDRKNESDATLYIMDTATGRILRKSIGGWEPKWQPFSSELPLSTFDDVIGKSGQNKKDEEERLEQIYAEYRAMRAAFRIATLEERVNMAESILVLQYTNSISDRVSSINVIWPGGRPVSNPEFRVSEVLKGPRFSKVKSRVTSQSSGDVEWKVSYRTFEYPAPGEKHDRASLGIREAQRGRQLSEIKNGEIIVLFSVPNEQYNIHCGHIIANKRLNFPEQVVWGYTAVSSEFEPAELVADIKTILAKEGHDAEGD